MTTVVPQKNHIEKHNGAAIQMGSTMTTVVPQNIILKSTSETSCGTKF